VHHLRLLFLAALCCPLFTLAQATTKTAETSNNTAACAAAGSPLHCQGGFVGMSDPNHNNETFNPVPGNVSKLDVHRLLYPGNNTKVFAHVMPWWCMTPGSTQTGNGTLCGSHIQIGYTANDTATAKAQVDDIASRGFDGLDFAYYGRLKDYNDVALKLRDEIESRCDATACPLTLTLMEEQGSFQWTKCPQDGGGVDQTACLTQAINDDLDYMDANFFNRRSYLRVDPLTKLPSSSGRPVVPFFICEECWTNPGPNWGQVWGAVRAHAQTLANGNGLFLFRNAPGFAHVEADGAFAWVNWYGTDPYGLNYLADFYAKSVLPQNQQLLPWGAAWKGFNDVGASWAPSPSRYMGQQCGNTWLQTFNAVNAYYSSSNQLPFLTIPTWNDYEEGTAIEKGLANCSG